MTTSLCSESQHPRRTHGSAWAALAALLALNGLACVTTKNVPGSCGSAPNSLTCLGTMTVPVEHEGLFVRASHEAIDAVHAPGFDADLRRFHEHHAATGKHSGAWANVDISRTIDGLRKTVSGIEIDTYGGPKGWFLLTFSGNLAYDGTSEGPVLINRSGLPRSVASIADTIIHEVAHRVGLHHPHSHGDLPTAMCEPPYVIGSLVQKQIVGSQWRPGINDCPLIDVP